MGKFKVGDRVAVYESGRRKTGTIKEIDKSQTEQSILIRLKWYHPKQLRRLKPKAAKAPGPGGILALVSALRVAREALERVAKADWRHAEIARDGLTHINELFEKENS